MNTIDTTSQAPIGDETLLRRVQQENQRQIIGKLLHDLRNPVHSIRITMELFGRLVRGEGDTQALAKRAAAYIGPAELALENLLINSERLGIYLATPAAPVVAPLSLGAWLEEIALLLRASRGGMQVSVSGDVDRSVQVLADRPRLSHAAVQCGLRGDPARVSLCAQAEADAVRIDVTCEAAVPREDASSGPFTTEELCLLITNAGGTPAVGKNGSISLSLQRSAD